MTTMFNSPRVYLPAFILLLTLATGRAGTPRFPDPFFAPATAPFHPPLALPDICATENTAFQAGEKIVYKLFYNWNFVWIPAGEVTFQVNDLPEQYHITVRGKTYPSYEWFYAVDDKYESYLNKKTLLPEIHIKDVQEGGYLKFDRTVFDQANRTAVSSRGKYRTDLEDHGMTFDDCMHDLISIVYYARNLDPGALQTNDEVPMKIMMDREVHPLALKYLGRAKSQKIKGAGFFDTHIFSPQLIAGEVFKEGDEMRIYVSNDRNKLPLLIESPVSVGSVQAVLKSYEGLRYEMEAKVK